jgi:hypothetical protein
MAGNDSLCSRVYARAKRGLIGENARVALAITPPQIALRALQRMYRPPTPPNETEPVKRFIPHASTALAVLVAALACALPHAARAQAEGGLYIADSAFSFDQAARRGLAQNARGTRFFVLALPPRTAALTTAAPGATAALRDQVIAQGGVLLVCQRDIDKGVIGAATLAPGVVAVRGFPPAGSNALPLGERYFPDENRAVLPAGNEALRRLRSSCS